MKNILVVGAGYVGLSTALTIAQKHKVTITDNVLNKIEKINNGVLPVQDEYMSKFFEERELDLIAKPLEKVENFMEFAFIILALPTNFDEHTKYFDTSILESVLNNLNILIHKNTTVIIKSTIPVGFTERMSEKYKEMKIIFVPEFLRETKTLYDCMNPQRIIVGCSEKTRSTSEHFVEELLPCIDKEDVPIFYMSTEEAEAVKLFGNAYLAMRVNFFNEIDTFCTVRCMNTEIIIKGLCADNRVGDFYNNPSFGYGGYCLPKDTKQLLVEYGNTPQKMITAIVEANEVRKKFITEQIIELLDLNKSHSLEYENKIKNITVGFYRNIMKHKSDNCRCSATQDIFENLKAKGINTILYEPIYKYTNTYYGSVVYNDLESFKKKSDLIIANRLDDELEDVKDKVYTKDLFTRD